jgi:large subunit ribosomal protein L9
MTKKVRKEVQIVLTQTMQKLGKAGSLVIVRSGYARNFLIPQQKGELATPTGIKTLEIKQKELETKEKANIDLCLKNKATLEQNGPFIIQKRIGADNKIFGKITLKQIRDLLENKTNIDLKYASIETPDIKELGIFSITVILHPTIQANIKIEILPQ